MFYTANMQDGKKILQYSNHILQLAETHVNIGVEISDNKMEISLVNGLLNRFDGLISALNSLGNEHRLFNFEFV